MTTTFQSSNKALGIPVDFAPAIYEERECDYCHGLIETPYKNTDLRSHYDEYFCDAECESNFHRDFDNMEHNTEAF